MKHEDCRVGMEVRFNDNDQFGIVEKLDDPNRCTVKVGPSPKETSKQTYENIRDNNTFIPNGTWVVNSRNNKAYLVEDRSKYTIPSRDFASDTQYTCKTDETCAQTIIINGAYLREFRAVGRPTSDLELFAAIKNRVPLIYIPKTYQQNDFCIAYRGDDREPEKVFKQGFQPRREYIQPIFRTTKKEAEGKEFPQFDIMTASGVCASRRPEAAGIFPNLKNGATRNVDEAYLYAFFAYQSFFTFQVQEETALKEEDKENQRYIEKLLQAEEVVIGKEGVPPQTILVAFHLVRTWNDKSSWQQGCSYKVEGYTRNSDCYYNDDPNYLSMIRSVEQHVWSAIDNKSSPKFV